MFGNGPNEACGKWSVPNWLRSRFHFSFAEWRDGPRNFGALRVLNDDLVQPHRGFGRHGHSDMEIVTLVVSGQLSHSDSTGRSESLGRGSLQYMSAGRGVEHSERNDGNEPVRFLQMWVMPRSRGLRPVYGSLPDSQERRAARRGQWEHVGKLNIFILGCVLNRFELSVGDRDKKDAPVGIDADCNFYLGEYEAGSGATFEVAAGRTAYAVQVEGRSTLGEATAMEEGDAAAAEGPATLRFDVHSASLILVIELRQ